MLDRDGAAARRRILYISRSMIRSAFHRVEGASRELLQRSRFLADRAAAAAPRRRRINTRNAEADAAAARRRGAVAFHLALSAREARLAEQLWCGFAHDVKVLFLVRGTAAVIGENSFDRRRRRSRARKLLELE